MSVELAKIQPGHIARIIDNGWRHGWHHRHSIACGGGRSCSATGALILDALQNWEWCPYCDGSCVSKRGDDKGYSCRCYTGLVPPDVFKELKEKLWCWENEVHK